MPAPDPDAPRAQPYGLSISRSPPPVVHDWHLIVFDSLEGGPLLITYYAGRPEFIDAMEALLRTVEWADAEQG